MQLVVRFVGGGGLHVFAHPRYGAMAVNWSVGGRLVAVWNFYYLPEGA